MEQNAGEIRTSDLAMATYLCVEGYHHVRLERDGDGKTAIWIFDGNGSIHRSAARYQAGEAFVEPKNFTTMLGRVRKELYQFLMAPHPGAAALPQ